MECKLCGKDKKGVQAHIIPKAFARRLTDDARAPILVAEGHHPKRSHTGIYDNEILCESCEKSLHKWDDCAIKLLIDNRADLKEIRDNGELLVLLSESYNYERLKLFAISLIWRAHVTSHPFFCSVDLGSWEDRARQRILARDPGPPEEFATLFGIFVSSKGYDRAVRTIHRPVKVRAWGGPINIYRVYLGEFFVDIKVDQRQVPDDIQPILLGQSLQLAVIVKDFESSGEFEALKDALRRGIVKT